jgi:hypothetical protein
MPEHMVLHAPYTSFKEGGALDVSNVGKLASCAKDSGVTVVFCPS